MVLAVEKWKSYLMGKKFIVKTDHAILRYLWEQLISTTQQEKWLIKLMAFDFVIEYKKGQENLAPDALSRQFEYEGSISDSSSSKHNASHLCALSLLIPDWIEAVCATIDESKELQNLIRQCRDGSLSTEWKVVNGMLYYKGNLNQTGLSPEENGCNCESFH